MLKKIKIKTKIIILFSIITLIIITISSITKIHMINQSSKESIQLIKTILLKEKKEKLIYVLSSVIYFSKTIYKNNNKILSKEAMKNKILDYIKTTRFGTNGYFWVNDTGKPYPKMILHPIKPSLNGKTLDDPKFNVAKGKIKNLFVAMVDVCENSKNHAGFVEYLWPKPGEEKPQPKLSYVHYIKEFDFIIGTDFYIDDIKKIIHQKKLLAKEEIKSAIIKFSFFALLAIIISSLLIIYTTKILLEEPLQKIINRIKDLAEGEGDLTKRLKYSNKDELFEVTHWINIFIDKIHKLVLAIQQTTIDAHKTSEQLKINSETLSASNEETNQQVLNISSATEEMTQNMEIISSSVEENSISIAEIANKSSETAKISSQADSLSKETKEIVTNLGESAKKIGAVIESITEIASQTNLLALNASIEAASAGEAGKGFAVVASEVKELAKESALSSNEIKEKILGIQKDTEKTVFSMNEINSIVNILNQHISSIVAAVEEQAITIKEITSNISQTTTTSGEITKNISGISQQSKEASNIAFNVLDISNDLSKITNTLSELIKQYKL